MYNKKIAYQNKYICNMEKPIESNCLFYNHLSDPKVLIGLPRLSSWMDRVRVERWSI